MKRGDLLEVMKRGVDSVMDSEGWVKWLDFQSVFHNYSFNNTLLILMQRPDATQVAGYGRWKQVKRHVKKGEKGIAIWAPNFKKMKVGDDEEEVRSLTGFRVAHVFDVEQTDGEPVPTISEKLKGDDGGLVDKLTQVADVPVRYGRVQGEGYVVPGEIVIEETNDLLMKAKTLVHEMAHRLLGHLKGRDITRDLMEFEAESVAYIVMNSQGVDTGKYSFGYVAAWKGEEIEKAIVESGTIVARTAKQIINQLEVQSA